MNRAIEFIETTVFSRQIREIATDDELQTLQRQLIAYPEAGSLIVGTGGLRKIRMASHHSGKSGGNRVIYFIATRDIIYLVLAYPKSAKETLSSADKRELRSLTRQLMSEKRI